MMIVGLVVMLLFWGLIIGGIVWLVRWVAGRRGRDPLGLGPRSDRADEILRERDARGDISHEEYEQRRHLLREEER